MQPLKTVSLEYAGAPPVEVFLWLPSAIRSGVLSLPSSKIMFSRLEQPLNMFTCISVTVLGMVSVTNEEQPLNSSVFMSVRPRGSVIVASF